MRITEITPILRVKEEKIRLAPYCRVSSDSEDQIHSFAAQIRYYTDYTKRNPKYELVGIYADEGITGTEMEKRDEFNRLLRDCKKGKIDQIITKSISRFARNTEELLVTLRFLSEIGVGVYFEEQGIDTTQLNAEIIATLPGMAAQQESESISGNLRWGIQKKMATGEYVCTHPPYGYRLENKENVVYEPEAQIVRKIYEQYLQGMGIMEIAEQLNENGIARPKRKGYNKWCKNTVRYILTNERYMGDALLQKKYTTEGVPFRVKVNRGERPMYYIENYNPPIISKETFNAVKELMASKRGRQGERQVYTLTKTLRCPDCGNVFRRQIINGKAYWLCAKMASNSSKCTSRRIREDSVYDAFIMMTYKVKEHRKDLIENLIKRLEYLQSRTSENIERIKEIDKEIANLSAKNLVVSRLHTSEVITTTEFTAQASEINNKISELRAERKKKLEEDENDVSLNELKTLNRIISEYEPNSSFDVELFEQIVEKIIVDDSTKMTFHLIGGLTFTEEIKEKGRCKVA